MFYTYKAEVPGVNFNDVNYEVVLRNCNGKLTRWMNTWQHEMEKGMLFGFPSSLGPHIQHSGRGIISLLLPQFFPPPCQALLKQLRDSVIHVPSTHCLTFLVFVIPLNTLHRRAAPAQACKLCQHVAQVPSNPYKLFRKSSPL